LLERSIAAYLAGALLGHVLILATALISMFAESVWPILIGVTIAILAGSASPFRPDLRDPDTQLRIRLQELKKKQDD